MLAFFALIVGITAIAFGGKIILSQKALEMSADEIITRIICIVVGLFCIYFFLLKIGLITK